jgi:CubicO group peptidase (beta-lactamase class C family)
MSSMKTIDKILIDQVKKNKTPSVQYVIFTTDSIIHSFQAGLADIENHKKADENTTYNAYSVTKTFTALAILQLAEQNKLDIDKSVTFYLPKFPYSTDITVRQLLTHSAGIPNPIPISWIHLAEEYARFDRDEFFKQIFKKHNKVKTTPNEKFAYSNLGYVLLGQIIEKSSGLRYEDYILKHIISPLNLSSKDLNFTISDMAKHAKGYNKKFSFSNLILGFLIDRSSYMNASVKNWISFKPCYVNGASYGGLIGTPFAFVRYIQELLKPDCNLISEPYKKKLFTENYINNHKATGMCLSWFTGTLNGKKYYSHAGGGGGYYCEIRIYPDLKMGSVIFFNRTGMKDERFLNKLDKYFLN